MSDSATGVDAVRQWTPRFEGWHLAPVAGVPVVGLLFVDRLNAVADTWRDSAGILSDVLHKDNGRLFRTADNYVAAEQASTVT
ncbi:hypothetical protein ACWEU6_07595 [Streptosporangium sandarakinum]|uniref:hypothetical protein n=1 Tax=Streptosporangium sandarakinum TaxID=1260955 RepID=UPI0036AB1E00